MSRSTMSDASLVQEALRGDPEAFREIVRRYAGRVVSIVRGFVRDGADADDLAQEAFVKAYASLHRFRCDLPFENWLSRIAVNHCINFVKRRRPATVPFETVLPDAAAPAEEETPDLRRLEEALCGLDAEDRLALLLFHREEKSYAEIAAILRVTEGAVKSRIHRARKKLREILSDPS